MKKRTPVRTYYHLCLLARLGAFVLLLTDVLADRVKFLDDFMAGLSRYSNIALIWVLLVLSMVMRLFPNRFESIGSEKHFSTRFLPTGEIPTEAEIAEANRGAKLVAAVWIFGNLPFLLAHMVGMLSTNFMVLMTAFYGICDIVCILLFCPFQKWLMHNRCCVTCRIYNWDYAMICTPLIGMKNFFAVSAVILSFGFMLYWELQFKRHPERFLESGNAALKCAHCAEQLCYVKRKLSGEKVKLI